MASSQNRNKRKQLAHIPAALTILLHAFERYAMDHSTYIFFLVAGLCFLSLVLFHKPIEKKLPWVDGAFFMIEGVLSTIVFFEFLHEGKKDDPLRLPRGRPFPVFHGLVVLAESDENAPREYALMRRLF